MSLVPYRPVEWREIKKQVNSHGVAVGAVQWRKPPVAHIRSQCQPRGHNSGNHTSILFQATAYKNTDSKVFTQAVTTGRIHASICGFWRTCKQLYLLVLTSCLINPF